MWIRSEDRAELVGQGVRLRRELAPGDAHDPIAPEGELAISRAVALEALPRGVDGVAVQLDDDALVGPEGVGLVWAEGRVHRRPRQRVSLAKSRNAVSKSLRMTVSPCWRWISRAR